MGSRAEIRKVVFRRGLVDDHTDLGGLKTTVIGRDQMSGEVVDAILDNGLTAAGGMYGAPEVADPVEVTSLQITHDRGVTEITVYNLGVMLLHTSDEIFPRVLRVQSAIEKQAEGRPQHPPEQGAGSKIPPVHDKQARKQKGKDVSRIYQIRVALLETEPLVWRRFLVPSNVPLHRLHLILQDVMGWSNYHAYRFQIGAIEYGELHPDNEFNELDFKNSRRTKLVQVLTKKSAVFQYEYDFGDGWEHMLLVEDIVEREPDTKYPVCLAGEGACPPEDCGGARGYAELLRTIADPGHEDYEDMMTWLGGSFDPNSFDIQIANLKLKSMRV